MIVRGPQITSSFWSNRGALLINASSSRANNTEILSAQRFLQKAVQISNENNPAWRALGFAFMALDQEESALNAWQSSNSEMDLELVDWGLLAVNDEKPVEAKAWFERAAVVNPQLGDPWFHLGQLYEKEGQWSKAAEAYQNGLERSADLRRTGQSNILFQLGELQYKLLDGGGAEKALAMYDLALEHNDFNNEWSRAQTFYRRGEALSILRRNEEAAASFARVIELRPDDDWAHIKLGTLAWEMERDYQKAETLLLKALQINDQNKFAYRNLGQVYYDSQSYAEALEMYQRVLILDAEDAIAREKVKEITNILPK